LTFLAHFRTKFDEFFVQFEQKRNEEKGEDEQTSKSPGMRRKNDDKSDWIESSERAKITARTFFY
jgi:hypothetical protein